MSMFHQHYHVLTVAREAAQLPGISVAVRMLLAWVGFYCGTQTLS